MKTVVPLTECRKYENPNEFSFYEEEDNKTALHRLMLSNALFCFCSIFICSFNQSSFCSLLPWTVLVHVLICSSVPSIRGLIPIGNMRLWCKNISKYKTLTFSVVYDLFTVVPQTNILSCGMLFTYLGFIYFIQCFCVRIFI